MLLPLVANLKIYSLIIWIILITLDMRFSIDLLIVIIWSELPVQLFVKYISRQMLDVMHHGFLRDVNPFSSKRVANKSKINISKLTAAVISKPYRLLFIEISSFNFSSNSLCLLAIGALEKSYCIVRTRGTCRWATSCVQTCNRRQIS